MRPREIPENFPPKDGSAVLMEFSVHFFFFEVRMHVSGFRGPWYLKWVRILPSEKHLQYATREKTQANDF